ncbi:hypothetical protein UM846_13625 [Staphylococcus aureus]|nr:hypothetical protein UM846_13625 [Staphylococcus aureus]WRN45234.1 hypothetical protein UM756_08610 [Staphylococcus aureus]
MSNKFRLDHSFINNKTETTSAVSKLSYEIENANLNGLPKTNLQLQFDRLKVTNEFPSNLEYIDSHTDKKYGVTASAFLNKDTGKVIIGMTGTNFKKKLLRSNFCYQGLQQQNKIKLTQLRLERI